MKNKRVLLVGVLMISILIMSFSFYAMQHRNNSYWRNGIEVINRIVQVFEKTDERDMEEVITRLQEVESTLGDAVEEIFYQGLGEYQQAYMDAHYEEWRSFDIIDGEKAEAIPVLMYHHLLIEEENIHKNNSAVITVEDFKKQMEILYDNNYHTITLYELEAFLLGKLDLPENSVVLTFDDGYLSNIEYAYPILKEYNFVASNFLITHTTGEISEEFNPNDLQYLSFQDMVNTLDVFSYHNHSHDMHWLEDGKGYLLTKSLEEVAKDLKLNKMITQSPYFAYPYGHYNEEILEILKALDMRMAFTVETGLVKPGDDLLQLNRYGIFPNTTLREFKKMIGLR